MERFKAGDIVKLWQHPDFGIWKILNINDGHTMSCINLKTGRKQTWVAEVLTNKLDPQDIVKWRNSQPTE